MSNVSFGEVVLSDTRSKIDLGHHALDQLERAQKLKKLIADAEAFHASGGAALSPPVLAFLHARIASFEAAAAALIAQGGK